MSLLKPLTYGILGLAVATPSVLALTPASDSFNAALLNATLWSVERGGSGKLVQKNGRLNFTVASSPTDDDYSIITLKNNRPGYNESWNVVLDVVNTTGKGDAVGVGIMIANAADPLDNVNLEFYGKGASGGFNFIGVTDDYDDWTQDIRANPGITKGSIRISFNKTSKLFTFSYDKTGSADGYQWTRLCTFSPTGKGGDRRGNWKMNATGGTFRVRLFGYSDQQLVAGGKAFIDNFALKAGN
jgi:hypothetical protein